MPYDIYILDKNDITVTGSTPASSELDGVTQGDGSHLVGSVITLNNNSWVPISIDDDDTDFEDNGGAGQHLNGAQEINGVTYADGTTVETEYGLILEDPDGNQYQVLAINVNNSSPSYGTVEGMAFIGGPGGFPPVGVPLTVVVAQEFPVFDESLYATPICFAAGTLIETRDGPRPIEDIAVGDLVRTQDAGYQPVRWHACRTFEATGKQAPIVFETGTIGNDRPLRLSPQHRVVVDDWRAELYAGEDAVLVPAKAFVNGDTITQQCGGTVTYHHIMFDSHQIIYSEGVATESFYPGAVGMSGLEDAVRDELLTLFPELAQDGVPYGSEACPDLRGAEASALLAA